MDEEVIKQAPDAPQISRDCAGNHLHTEAQKGTHSGAHPATKCEAQKPPGVKLPN